MARCYGPGFSWHVVSFLLIYCMAKGGFRCERKNRLLQLATSVQWASHRSFQVLPVFLSVYHPHFVFLFFSFSLSFMSLRSASGLYVFSLSSIDHLFSVCGFCHLEHWAFNMQVILCAGLNKLDQTYPSLSAISSFFFFISPGTSDTSHFYVIFIWFHLII